MDWNDYCISQLENTKKLYEQVMHKKWDFKNPITFTEKLWYLTVYDNSFLKTYCSDKITLVNYCESKIGKNLCIKQLGVYNKPEDIDYSKLPNKFVIKCNHGSGWNIIVKDKSKINKKEINNKLNCWLKTKWSKHEFHYHNIPPKILIEEYKENIGHSDLTDYKFYCFNGKPEFCQVITDRHTGEKISHYDMNWIYKPEYDWKNFESISNLPKPKHYNEMIEYAKVLSADFKFVRVDFYEIDEKVYLGELTFIPMGGNISYKNKNTDLFLGSKLKL